MFIKIKNLLRKILFYDFSKLIEFGLSEIYSTVYLQPIKKSFSQKGEDILIDKFLNGFKGLYVDIGANDPHRFSNTKRFYLKGERGINIEPNPINYKRFITDRTKDININCAIGKTTGKMAFYIMFPDTLSTCSKHARDELVKQGYINEKRLNILIMPLSVILEKYCSDKHISFFSIDTEGYDLNVLKSNNWKKFRPKIICIESSSKQEDQKIPDKKNELFLKKQGYVPIAHTEVNDIYIDKSFQ